MTSAPCTSWLTPETSYRSPVGHFAAWCAKKSAINDIPRRSTPDHREISTSVAVCCDCRSTRATSCCISRWTSVRASKIVVIGLSRGGCCVIEQPHYPSRRKPCPFIQLPKSAEITLRHWCKVVSAPIALAVWKSGEEYDST